MSDIVERLRTCAAKGAGVSTLIDAATEIEQLRAQVGQLRSALQQVINAAEDGDEISAITFANAALSSTDSEASK